MAWKTEVLDLYSEPYSARGGIDARASKRAIGKPRLAPWELFIREMLQNSWDARLTAHGPIDFFVDAFWLEASQMTVLRNQLFKDRPKQGMQLDATLTEESVALLVVTDRGTRGLGGPTRADIDARAVRKSERTDFVDFVRNVGRAAEKGYSGGTYGFGKGVLWDASAASTVLAYTRTTVGGRSESRFMAIGLGDDFSAAGKRFTGRHWWGVRNKDTGAEPLTGRKADELAMSLGMDRLQDPDLTGTALAVLAPMSYADETVIGIVEEIAEGILWSAWPHMVGVGQGSSIGFELTHEREPVELGDPRDHPRLKHFVDAYDRVNRQMRGQTVPAGWPWEDVDLRSTRPAGPLGRLSFRRYQGPARGTTPQDADRRDPNSHVALMRGPRFIVKYLDAPPDPRGLSLAGVFVADEGLEDEFARSEPVAHDDWLPENLQLEKYARNPVKQSLDKLKETLRRKVVVDGPSSAEELHEGTARVATLLGSLLSGIDGGDARQGKQSGGSGAGGGGAARVAKTRLDPAPTLRVEGSVVVARFRCEVTSSRSADLRVLATPRVILDGNASEPAGDAPAGMAEPSILGWFSGEGDIVSASERVVISSPVDEVLFIDVVQPPDTMIGLDVTVEEAQS